MAGKILFPIPNRRLSKRLYRLTAPTLLLWGKNDKLISPVYAERFRALIPHAKLALIDQAGHMVPYDIAEHSLRLFASEVMPQLKKRVPVEDQLIARAGVRVSADAGAFRLPA